MSEVTALLIMMILSTKLVTALSKLPCRGMGIGNGSDIIVFGAPVIEENELNWKPEDGLISFSGKRNVNLRSWVLHCKTQQTLTIYTL
jgi:hypothetical protein